MKASVGDRIVINGPYLGETEQGGEILTVEGPEGAPPYEVRWEVDGCVSLFFPGPDATIQHLQHTAQGSWVGHRRRR